MYAVCSLVSWISASASSDDAHLIRTVTAWLEYTARHYRIAFLEVLVLLPAERYISC
jgi:hypothetical protein